MTTTLISLCDGRFSVEHLAGLDLERGLVVAAVRGAGLTVVVERKQHETRVFRLETTARGQRFCTEASGFHLIWLYEKLSDGDYLYKFTTRTVALARLLALLDEKYPTKPFLMEE